ncbi:MAG: ankyrin repeat domain-containing protein, partial [bacterium]
MFQRLHNLVAMLVGAFAAATIGTANADEDAFRTAIVGGDIETIQGLSAAVEDINLKDATGKNALMVVAKSGRCDLVERLLELGANPHSKNNNGGTPVMFAAIYGDTKCIR